MKSSFGAKLGSTLRLTSFHQYLNFFFPDLSSFLSYHVVSWICMVQGAISVIILLDIHCVLTWKMKLEEYEHKCMCSCPYRHTSAYISIYWLFSPPLFFSVYWNGTCKYLSNPINEAHTLHFITGAACLCWLYSLHMI